MPENEFEKQVQQKMGELQFVPSAAAWEKVEKQIADKKKRRRILLWLPLLFMLLAGAGWYFALNLTTHEMDHDQAVNEALGREKDLTARSKKPVEILREKIKTDLPESNKRATATLDNHQQDKILVRKNFKNNRVRAAETKDKFVAAFPGLQKTRLNKMPADRVYNGNAHPFTNAKNARSAFIRQDWRAQKNAGSGETEARTSDEQTASKRLSSGTSGRVEAELAAVNKEAENNVPDTTKSAVYSSNKETVTAKKNPDSIYSIPMDSTSHIAKNRHPVKHNKKVEWGLSFSGGSSGSSTGFPGLSEKNFGGALSYSNPQTNGSGNLNNGNAAYTNASPPVNHFAWSAGIIVRKPIGKTWRLVSGLHYSTYSTGVLVGTKTTDSLQYAPVVYRNGRSTSYVNHLHFIEVPVGIEKRLGTRSRFSVNTGLAFSVLTATNQLQFDQQANLYYADRSGINKTQWNFLLGMNYRLLQKNVQMEIGPLLRYQLQNTFNNDVTGNGHLFFAGLGVTILFDKHKR